MKRENHVPTVKILNWTMCQRCGLVYLNNDATRKAIREGCDPKSIARRQGWSEQQK